MLLSEKVAVITGAASERGIGREVAKLFAEQGAKIAILDLNGMAAESAALEIGETHRGYYCNVTNRKEVEETFAHIAEDLGHPAILINNAGITQPKRIDEISESDYEAVLDVNLRGTFLCSKAALPYMREGGEGSIVCMSSVSAKRGGGVFGGPHYSAAKAGILGLARALARDLAPEGIRVNAVAPGFIDTDITKGQLTEEQRASIAASIPLGRAGNTLDVAWACLFLASSICSPYITGEVMDVNGGSHID